jgi:hypothetical protein
MDSHYFSSTCEHDADNLALFFWRVPLLVAQLQELFEVDG